MAAADPRRNKLSPEPIVAEDGEAVTPNNGADLANTGRCLYVGVTGDVKVTTIGGTTLTFKNVPVGFFPVRCTRVFATGTTASEIINLW